MSKEINNREYRANVIKELLSQLHAGKSVDEVKQQFAEAFEGVSATEISEAEQMLMADGLAVEEVQKLCDVHAAVLGGSVEQIHAPDTAHTPGHPAHTLMAENRAIEKLIENRLTPHLKALEQGESVHASELAEDLKALYEIDKHYSKKENLMFPFMEKHGITAPPKVMWGVDDEIRAMIKQTMALAAGGGANAQELGSRLREALEKVGEMVYKEENILLPMLFETLSGQEWQQIADESAEIGFCLIPAPPSFKAGEDAQQQTPPPAAGAITLPTGVLWPNELIRMLDALPVDITFVGSDDTVRYFSQGAERVFPRTKTIIGRKVTDCHPPASVHIVEGIVADFRSGKKDHEDFWIKMGGKYVLIRYYAVRDETGEYLGTLEVTQDIAPLQQLSGEKRLVT